MGYRIAANKEVVLAYLELWGVVVYRNRVATELQPKAQHEVFLEELCNCISGFAIRECFTINPFLCILSPVWHSRQGSGHIRSHTYLRLAYQSQDSEPGVVIAVHIEDN